MSSIPAIVCRSSRRHVDAYSPEKQLLRGRIDEGVPALCVGDAIDVRCSGEPPQYYAEALHPRRNLFKRSSSTKTKLLAANVDMLFLITAPGAICKMQNIDRMLIAAASASIPCTLVWNKCDLDDFAESEPLRAAYRAAGYTSIVLSAKTGIGMGEFHELLNDRALQHVVLTGVSGVGKSSLLNALLDQESARTQELSARSGYGRQTTSEAFGYLLPRPELEYLMVCDLPGVQQFGLAHLEEAQIRNSYPEFSSIPQRCRFANCTHSDEPDCTVREAVALGQISPLRFESYRQIINEWRQML